MRAFTLICALLLLALGAAGFYGWGVAEERPRTLISAIPAGFGALMLCGLGLAFLLPRTGMQMALLAALAGFFSGLGRLTPSYLKETLDWATSPVRLIVAMVALCLLYLVVRVVAGLFPSRSRMVPSTIGPPEEKPESRPC